MDRPAPFSPCPSVSCLVHGFTPSRCGAQRITFSFLPPSSSIIPEPLFRVPPPGFPVFTKNSALSGGVPTINPLQAVGRVWVGVLATRGARDQVQTDGLKRRRSRLDTAATCGALPFLSKVMDGGCWEYLRVVFLSIHSAHGHPLLVLCHLWGALAFTWLQVELRCDCSTGQPFRRCRWPVDVWHMCPFSQGLRLPFPGPAGERASPRPGRLSPSAAPCSSAQEAGQA